MFKKLIHFANTIIKSGHASTDPQPTSQENQAPKIQSPSEYQPQLRNAISPEAEPESANASGSDKNSVNVPDTRSRPPQNNHSSSNSEGSNTPDLDTLYRSITLSQGMLYLAGSIASFNVQTYIPRTEQWLKDSDFQTRGKSAITAKRQNDYAQAIAVFNDLAQGCPYYYQIHHSMMKILGASGDLEPALRALKLWCVATIPVKALRLGSLDSQPTTISDSVGPEQLPILAGWAIADTTSMYHLGSLQMMGSDELSPEVKESYILSLQGKKTKALHDPKIAIQRGKEVAQDLPWEALMPVMNTKMWQYLVWRSQQQAQHLEQRRRAA